MNRPNAAIRSMVFFSLLSHALPIDAPNHPALLGNVQGRRTRTTCVSIVWILTLLYPGQEEVKGAGGKMLRNQSAPHFAVMSRNYSTVFTPIPRYGTLSCTVQSLSTAMSSLLCPRKQLLLGEPTYTIAWFYPPHPSAHHQTHSYHYR
jgi:hypothetical protein